LRSYISAQGNGIVLGQERVEQHDPAGVTGDDVAAAQAELARDGLGYEARAALAPDEWGERSAAGTTAGIEDRDELARHATAYFLILDLCLRIVPVLPAGIVQAAEFCEIVGELGGYFHLK
jgi:hypothetical protein